LSPTQPNAIFSPVNRPSVTPAAIRSLKGQQPIAALTTYDYPLTRLLDEAGIPLLLVGDSLGMVVLGYPNTTHVTMADMEHHVRAAARAQPAALLAADLPYRSCESPELALANARRLMAAGAQAVKAEGGRAILDSIRAILADGIPFLGHLGMLPQNILNEGGYHIKGRTDPEHQDLLLDANALADAGAFAIVLELVSPPVAREITRSISIPTIGIGSGPDCDGQILVTHDLIGLFPWFTPRHVKPYVQSGAQIRAAVQTWHHQLKLPPPSVP
jgi:3-methyl-2-oxobutanoate hydroxymethyltransferase